MFELIFVLLMLGAMALTGFTLVGCIVVVCIAAVLLLVFGAIGILIQWAPWILAAAIIYWLVSDKRCNQS
ncbi:MULTISPECIES: envelope stress response protein PspG [unclassified Motilimonas]|uniref:envelope stress response protein PspG n=1 Tax=Motilimonas TaxID=1914248 RepID=UPI001E2DE954|nr:MULTISPECIES: envelope stress response protein PspG [unclassified Motilimonas]MCE0558135.1 envelope stress response protein PspG [Motilimonas sp. E26]MDO6524494.1 envelope stress response protein PspG [Motilimonas sp. 1_MG-2023]